MAATQNTATTALPVALCQIQGSTNAVIWIAATPIAWAWKHLAAELKDFLDKDKVNALRTLRVPYLDPSHLNTFS
jgi:hypothetical protein